MCVLSVVYYVFLYGLCLCILQLGVVCAFECVLVFRCMCALFVNSRVALHGLMLCFVFVRFVQTVFVCFV